MFRPCTHEQIKHALFEHIPTELLRPCTHEQINLLLFEQIRTELLHTDCEIVIKFLAIFFTHSYS